MKKHSLRYVALSLCLMALGLAGCSLDRLAIEHWGTSPDVSTNVVPIIKAFSSAEAI
jgi:hypothetical protein